VVELGEIDPRSAAGLAACKRLEEAGATAFSMTVRERESESDYERVLALAQQTTLPVVVRDRVIDRYLVTMARAHGAAAAAGAAQNATKTIAAVGKAIANLF
jgi:indole-3-glycerol phosphate synthase